MNLAELIQQAHDTATSKGWWEDNRTFGDQVALQHSELSEALEEYRVHGLDKDKFIYFDDENPEKPLGIAIEYADVLIRIFDTCAKYGIPLDRALAIKMAFNKTRPKRHGHKVI